MDKNKKVEIFIGVSFLMVGIYVIYSGFTLPGVEGYFPLIIGMLMSASAICVIAKSLKNTQSIIHIEKINCKNIFKTAASLMIYVFALPRIGYVLSTFLLGLFIIYSMNSDRKFAAVIYPLLFVAVLFLGFKVMLHIPLPMGCFFSSL